MDYFKTYGRKSVSKFQEGGMAPAPAPAPEQGGGGGGGSIEEMVLAAYQSQDPNMALEVIGIIAEAMMAEQGGGGGGAPAPGGEPMPAARRGMRMTPAPTFKKGGKL